ncbi:50S ribosomal protein L5 [Patescibacteria group bacterium]
MALAQTFQKNIIPKLAAELSIKNHLAVPRVKYVVINARIKNTQRDEKFMKTVTSTLERITGQKPVITTAKKSIASFKLRQGMPVGMKVTLRGKRMYDFIERLVNVALPRVRDFQGLPMKSFGKSGSYTIGFKEHIVFPEIKSDEVEQLHGLQVTLVTSASDPTQGEALLRSLGFPLQSNNK